MVFKIFLKRSILRLFWDYFAQVFFTNLAIFDKNDCIILNVLCFSTFMQKNIKIGQTVLKIQQFEKSSDLIGRELSKINLENENFPRHGVCTESQPTIIRFILGHFQQKLMTQFCTKVQKAHFCLFLDPFFHFWGK